MKATVEDCSSKLVGKPDRHREAVIRGQMSLLKRKTNWPYCNVSFGVSLWVTKPFKKLLRPKHFTLRMSQSS